MTETAKLTLAEFLLARIAEDDEAARAAEAVSPSPWSWTGQFGDTIVDGRGGSVIYDDSIDDRSAPHIARWDPARVLAECEAKRAIIETRQLLDAHIRQIALARPEEARDTRSTRAGLDVALAALALPYADHPDYRSEWKP